MNNQDSSNKEQNNIQETLINNIQGQTYKGNYLDGIDNKTNIEQQNVNHQGNYLDELSQDGYVNSNLYSESNTQQPMNNNYQANTQQPMNNNYQANMQQPMNNNYQTNMQQPMNNNYQANMQQPLDNNYQTNMQQPLDNNYQANMQQPLDNNYQANMQQPLDNNYQTNTQQPMNNNYQANMQQPLDNTTVIEPIKDIQNNSIVQPVDNEKIEEKIQVNEDSKQEIKNDDVSLTIVNPINPEEILRTDKLTEKKNEKIKDKKEKEKEKPVKEKKHKEIKNNGNKKLKIIIILLIIAIITALSTIIIINAIKANKKKNQIEVNKPIVTPSKEKITLSEISENIKTSDKLAKLNKEFNITNENNKIIISYNEKNKEIVYEFILNDRTLNFEYAKGDEIGKKLFLIVNDNIGQYYDHKENDVYNYLNTIDFKTSNVDGINFKEENQNYIFNIDIDKNIDTSALKTMYFETKDLEEYKNFIKGSGTVEFEKGNLKFYKEGNNKETTIIIAEKEKLSDITYKSILSVIELLYPTELENFKTSYPKLETISFDRYTITENPNYKRSINTFYEENQNEYKFIEIKINKAK